METTIDRLFLDYSVQRLRQLTGRIDECLNRLPAIWMQIGPIVQIERHT